MLEVEVLELPVPPLVQFIMKLIILFLIPFLFAVLWCFIWVAIGVCLCLPVFTPDEDLLPYWYVLFIS